MNAKAKRRDPTVPGLPRLGARVPVAPSGRNGNSPAIYRWDSFRSAWSPVGTTEIRLPDSSFPSLHRSAVPTGLDVLSYRFPGVETPGYCRVVPPERFIGVWPCSTI